MLCEVTYLDGEVSYEDAGYNDITNKGFKGSGRSAYIVCADGQCAYHAKVGVLWYIYTPEADLLSEVPDVGERHGVVVPEVKKRIATTIESMFNAL